MKLCYDHHDSGSLYRLVSVPLRGREMKLERTKDLKKIGAISFSPLAGKRDETLLFCANAADSHVFQSPCGEERWNNELVQSPSSSKSCFSPLAGKRDETLAFLDPYRASVSRTPISIGHFHCQQHLDHSQQPIASPTRNPYTAKHLHRSTKLCDFQGSGDLCRLQILIPKLYVRIPPPV
jgi:hypothetical protein